MEDEEYAELYRHIDDLKRQNQILRLENELGGFSKELGDMTRLYSTPAQGKEEQALASKRVWSSIPKGRPDDAQGAEAEVSDLKNTDSHEIPDRFVTTRKKQASSTPKSKDVVMKPATYDGSVAWMDYKAHFDACAELNGWTDQQKGLYLSVSLRGQAQGVFGNLGSGKHDYDDLIKALEERFAPPNQTELYRVQLRERRQKASESMAELGQDIRRLTNLAYPKAPSDVRETLAKEQFVDALVNSEMRLKIKQARPVDLNDAVRHAVELEAFCRAETRQAGQGFINTAASSESTDDKKLNETFSTLSSKLEEMTKAMNKLVFQQRNTNNRSGNQPYKQGHTSSNRQPAQGQRTDNRQRGDPGNYKPGAQGQNRPTRRCYNCNSDKHLMRNCPQPKCYDKETDKTDSQDKGSVCLSSPNHAGIFVQAKIGEYGADCLVDTGATLSLISCKVWSTIKGAETPERFDKDIISASGNILDTKGRAKVCFNINGNSCVLDVVITEMDIDVILGLDFMLAHNVVIDIVGMVMHIKGNACPLIKVGKLGCYRVIVKERVSVPSRSEVVIEGQLVDCDSSDDCIGIIETSDGFLNSNRGVVARTLVNAGGKISIRYANFSNESQVLYPGTNIADFSPVQLVKTVPVQEINSKPPRNLPKHLTDLYNRTSEGMSSTQKKQIANLLGKYGDIFSKDENDLGRTGIIKHKISVDNSRPIKQGMRRVPVHMQDEVDRQLDLMLEHDIIQPSGSPWASPIVLVKKKDGSRRFCIDYRRLNDVTVKDAYPLPRIDESLDQLAGSKWFSCLDLSAGYWQVEVEPEDRPKTAFITRRGLFEFNVMPFGLCNAPASFERLMELVLSGLHWQICLIYLDDIIIFGKTFAEMIKNLEIVFERFSQAGLKLKAPKCQLFKQEVDFLGHVINEQGVHTNPQKIECVKNWPVPNNITELRSFLGLCSYYRRFIADYSHIAKPLTRLTEKDQKFNWTSDCSDAFDRLKHMLVTAPILAHPDFTKPFILDTDASNLAIGAVLSQKFGNTEKVIAYASRTLTKSERKYCVTRKELLALVHFVKYFRHYLYGQKFTARTDHASLRWLTNFKNPEGQVARWLEVLSTFSMTIEHRPGRLHGNADGLSRRPCDDSEINSVGESPCHDAKQLNPSCMQVESASTEKSNDDSIDLKNLQTDDDELAIVRSWVHENKRPGFNVISSEGYALKSLWNQFSCLELHDNLLVRRQENVDKDNVVIYQVIVPRKARRSILYACHDMKTSGHLGVSKTVSKIKQKFYWPGLQSDVRSYIAGCGTCSKRKGPIPTKRAPMQIVRSGFPMERIAIDILGELPETAKGNKYIVVIGDYFTKWTEALPIPNMEACTVAKVLVENVLCRFGIPQAIHSDQGRQFESKLFQEMCKLLGIHKTRTTPYHPQSDGMVERFNRTLAAMLSAYVSTNQKDWDDQLPYVTMAYRSSEHETTGLSPNMLMFGREVSTPLDLMFELPNLSKPIPNNQWVWELRDRIETAHTLVRQYTQQAMHRQKRNRYSRLSFETYKIGDQVFVYFPVKKVGMSAKFTSFWRGPFKITGKLSDIVYKVNCGYNGTEQNIHCDRIRLCKQQILRGESEQVDEDVQSHAPENSDETMGTLNNDKDNLEEVIHQPNIDIESDVESDRQRVRRKPVWAKDYVFSCRMPNLKKTQRKQHSMAEGKTCCTWCKGLFDAGAIFEEHIVACYRNRWPCNTCGQTFKQRAYLEKHRENQHGVKSVTSSTPKPEASTSAPGSENVENEDEGNSDWDMSPDVSLVESSDEEDDTSEPVRSVEKSGADKVKTTKDIKDPEGEKIVSASSVQGSSVSLLKGRLFRKATEPTKPINPAKKKRDATVLDAPAVERPGPSTKKFVVKCIKENESGHETVITENGDEIYKSCIINKRLKKEAVELNLGELIPDGLIKTSDIKLQVYKGSNVELSVTYCPQDD